MRRRKFAIRTAVHSDHSVRFEFGANGRRLLSVLTDERIRNADRSLLQIEVFAVGPYRTGTHAQTVIHS